MKAEFKRDPEEVDKLLNRIDSVKPSKYPGMSYEQGVEDALAWVLGDDERKPEL